MRMTDIQRREVRPGPLVEWTLDPAAVRTVRGRPVRADLAGHSVRHPGRLDLDVLQEALRGWMLRPSVRVARR
ncbi:hypothetical protein GCM10010510_47960 [Streptomyces anandii JCM 4720]|nr:hypothetical protein GCM10010510_47960 [Streptomyces anandii JCM 4720]